MNLTDRAFIHKLKHFLLVILLGILSFFVFLLLIWSFFIGGLFLIIFAFIMLAVFLPFKIGNLQITITKLILGIAALVMIFMFSDLPIMEVQKRFDNIDDVISAKGPVSLTTADKLTVYGTNLIISFYGRLLGFPEYGKQSLRLCVKSGDIRNWESEFALKSPKVTGVLNNWTVLLKRQRRDISHLMLPARTISWQSTLEDRRVALALNPVKLEAKASPTGDRWRLDCKATTRMKYRKGASRILLTASGKKLVLPEGPFWALQQIGWLKPYTAIWEWSLYSDDERLVR